MALTPNGLTVERLPEIIESIEASQRQLIDPNISTKDDEFLGQLNLILADALASAHALAQAVNDNKNLNAAEGRHLDELAALRKVFRITDTSTSGNVEVSGKPNSTIPVNTIVANGQTGDRYNIASDVLLNPTNTLQAKLSLAQVQAASPYSVTLDGVQYAHTTDTAPTTTSILEALRTLINADAASGAVASVVGSQLVLTRKTNSFSVSVSLNMRIDEVTATAFVVAQQQGPIAATTNTINTIITPSLGFVSVTNSQALIAGRFRETDEEFRARVKESSNVSGKATLTSVRQALRATNGVAYAKVVENSTMTVDSEGRPPKSIEAIVQGASDQDIAQVLFEYKGAGIETFGTTLEVVLDEGVSYNIRFSRPTQVNMAVRVTYALYDEESFPSDALLTIREVVLNHINNLNIDVDVIPKRMFGPIYQSVSGIGELIVEVQPIDTPGAVVVPEAWQENTFPIADREFAQTSISDIYIVGV